MDEDWMDKPMSKLTPEESLRLIKALNQLAGLAMEQLRSYYDA